MRMMMVRALATLLMLWAGAAMAAAPSAQSTGLTLGTTAGTAAAGNRACDNTGATDCSGAVVTATGGTTARTNAVRAAQDIGSLFDTAKCDGVTNDYAAIKVSLSKGGLITVPPGTCLVTLPSGVGLGTVLGGTHIQGAGITASHIIIQTTDTAYLNALALSNNDVTFEDVWIEFRLQSGQQATLFQLSGSGIKFVRSKLSTNYTYSGGVGSSLNYLFSIAGNSSDVLIRDCDISNAYYFILKTSASTAVNARWRFEGNRIHDMGDGLDLNSPNGSFDDVSIIGNTFSVVDGPGGAGHFSDISLAGVTHVRIVGNQFTGNTDSEVIHVEEGSNDLTIEGNTSNVSSNAATYGSFIRLAANDVGDGATYKTPTRVSIKGNAILSAGTGTAAAIAFFDVGHGASAQQIVVADNVIDGYATGVSAGPLGYLSSIRSNMISNATTGVSAYRGGIEITGNSIISVTTGLYSQVGGTFGKNIFHGVQYLAGKGGGAVSLLGWTQSYDYTQATAASYITTTLGGVGSKILSGGTFTTSIVGAGGYDMASYSVSFDGSTLTQSRSSGYNSGGSIAVSSTPFSLGSGPDYQLTFKPYSGGAAGSLGSIQVDFNGIQIQ